MLVDLQIKDIVLISSLTLSFSDGLSALTGETGAGKSILLDSLGLCIGHRADASLVRKGADKASVSASFEIDPKRYSGIITRLKENDIDAEDNDCLVILKRTLSKEGRSKAYINDAPVSVAYLKEIGGMLLDLHGQFETHGLMKASAHGDYLDQYARNGDLLQGVSDAYHAWADARKALKKAEDDLYDLQREEQWVRDCVQSLAELAPEKGEEETLHQKRQGLAHREGILSALSSVCQALDQEGGVLEKMAVEIKALERIHDMLETDVQDLVTRLDSAFNEMRDISDGFADGAYRAETGGETLEEIDDRLHKIRSEYRKHRCAADDLPDLLETMQERLALIDHRDDRIGTLEADVVKAKDAYEHMADKLTKSRQRAAQEFDASVQGEFAPLKLSAATFKTDITLRSEDQWNEAGKDHIHFCVQTNAGSDFGGIDKIASGGELSRIMLALKVALSDVAPVPVMIFDEVDSGMGGATADAIGERLAKLAQSRQILSVTHSPQIAARAQAHYVVSKQEESAGVTTTCVTQLEGYETRGEEIARMLSGADVTEEARAAAHKLLDLGMCEAA